MSGLGPVDSRRHEQTRVGEPRWRIGVEDLRHLRPHSGPDRRLEHLDGSVVDLDARGPAQTEAEILVSGDLIARRTEDTYSTDVRHEHARLARHVRPDIPG